MKKILFTMSILTVFSVFGIEVQAVSQNECAIWLCLPGGFPSGCGAAHSAMMSRIRDGKSPLPNFSSCAVNPPKGSGSHMTATFGPAAYVPQRTFCDDYSENQGCRSWTTTPEYYVRGRTCSNSSENGSNPPGCTRTRRYVEVFIEQTTAGEPYYW